MNEILRQVGALTPERREVFKQILSARGIDLSTLIFPLERGGRTEFAASFAQERLWFLDQLDPESPLYNIPCPVRMRGQLNLPALIASLNEITRRHEVLRTTFTARNGEPLQVIHPEIEFPLSFINLDTLPEEKRESEALRLAQGEASQPFHLETGPLVRLLLIRLAPREHIALLTFHHIIADGWSIGVFLRELATLYSARCANQDSPLPDLELQYCDYSAWQRERLSGKCLDEHLGYWKQQFAGPSPSLELPFDFPRPAQISGRGSVVHFSIPVEIATSFNRLCREQGVTLFMGLLGVFQTLLYRCTGQEDFCIGTPVAGRSVRDLEELIGFFVNTLPLMLHVSSDWTFLDLLRQTRDTCLEGFAHQEIPFEMLVDALGVERVTDQPPLFQVMFVLQNMPTTMYTLPDLILESISLHNSTSKYDLSLILGEENGQISGTLEYRDDLFLPASVERMGKYFSTLLESALSHPETCLGRLEILAPGDKHALLAFPKASFKIDSPSLHQRILQMASLHPETVAVICGDQQITYSQLDRISTALAHDLAAHGVMPDTPVGLYANRSVDAITAMLGILRAGGAYVPLDPNYPADRLSYISQNAQLKVVVAGPENQDLAVDLFPDQAVLHVQDAFDSESPASAEIILPASDPRHLAYILYTSGSTGRPKGVMIEHGSALHLLAAYEQVAPMTVPPVGTSVAPFGFDVSVQEIFSVLCWGGTLHILQQDMAANPEAIGQYLIDHGVNSAYFPPALLSDLAGWFEQNQLTLPLRRVLVGVEPIKQATLQRYVDLAPGIHVINGYGPTETTICATFYNFVEAKEPERRTPLGSPVPGYSVYLVDQNLQLSPPGAIGEILIAGPGLARGYLNNPELTAEKFISNPFADQPGEMAYRTGDLARILPDGLIEFVGRMDHQVKIRGFRVETGEVEHLLGSHPGVRSVVVLARNDPRSSSDSPEKHLIAYVIPDPSILQSPDVLRHYLKARLPEYMLPSAYVFMEAFPQTQNGKLDRKALPEPDWASQHNADKNSAPATPTEQILANLWGQILGIPQINRKDDFFELGGHSLMAMRLVSRIREVFRVDFALRQFFATHSLAEMASAIDQMLARGVDVPILPIRPISRLEPMLLSLGQQRLWFLDQFEPGNPVYNIPSAHRLKGSLDLNRLEAALSGVIARHEILRTTFPDQSGQPGLKILPELHIPIPLVNLSALPAAQCEAEAIRLVREESVRPFDLAKGPLLRMLLVRLAPEETIISLVMHHIISDGWSSGIFISELVSLYIAEVSGQPASLSDLPIQYADYAAWQREWLHGDVLDRQQKYWEARLADLPVLELPTDHPRPAVQTSNGAHYHFVLSAEMMPLLKTLALQENVTPFMLLLAAFQALLGRYADQDTIPVGTVFANRTRPEVESLIGFFVNTLVIRGELGGEPTFRELLARTRETCLGAYAHQDIPFEKLVDALQPERDTSRSPLFQVMFILQNAPMSFPPLPGLAIDWVDFDPGGSMFDLSLVLEEAGDHFSGGFEYNTDLFDPMTIEQMAAHFQILLKAALLEPNRPIWNLPLLSEAEERQILFEWNATARPSPLLDRTVHQLIEEQVERTPDAIALAGVAFLERLTYAELNRRANQLAHYLHELGVQPDTVVGLSVQRSPEMGVGLLGIMKAGGAYLPLDVSFPHERLEFMLSDAQVSLVVTTAEHAGKIPFPPDRIVRLDQDWPEIQTRPDQNPASGALPENLVYVIYTSGSTGKPKGVALPHRAIVNHNLACVDLFSLTPQDRILQFSSLNFDAAVEEIFPVWISGGLVVLRPVGEAPTGEQIFDWFERFGLTILDCSTAYWHALVADLAEIKRPVPASLRLAAVGGEKAFYEKYAAWKEITGVDWLNTYGPTEAAIIASWYRPTPEMDAQARMPIGRPIQNMRFYVLDRHGQIVPVGVQGELNIAGIGLARGYLNQPELTAERFVREPFDPTPGARMYKTGDRVRYLADGNLEYIGRIDQQIKLRGFRIELGEIEAVLSQHPGVKETTACVHENHGRKRLAAYYVPTDPGAAPSPGELADFLHSRLPEYLLPSAIVPLDRLPLTPTGKLDRKSLPVPDLPAPSLEASAELTPVQTALRSIWAKVLSLDPGSISPYDNFFALGGDSILSIQVVSRARQAGLLLTPRDLFENPTLAKLGEAVKASAFENTPPPPTPAGLVDLSPIQRWFFDQNLPAPHHWNQSLLLSIPQGTDLAALKSALQAVIDQHPAFHLAFIHDPDGEWASTLVEPPYEFRLLEFDLRGLAPENQNREMEALGGQVQTSMNLAQPPLFRAALFDLGQERGSRLLLAAHHLIMDGVSWRILLEDLILASQGQPLPPPTVSFPTWSRALPGVTSSPQLLEQLTYWQSQPISSSRVPLDVPAGANREADIASQAFVLSKGETDRLLHQATAAYHTDIQTLLVAALFQSLVSWSGKARWQILLESHGRESQFDTFDLSHTIGWFTALYPFGIDLSGVENPAQLLRKVKEELRKVPRNGVGYGLLRWLHPDPKIRQELDDTDRGEITFNYLGQVQAAGEKSAFSLSEEPHGPDHGPDNPRSSIWDVTAVISGGQLRVEWAYSRGLHRDTTILEIVHICQDSLRQILDSAASPDSGALVASDFPLAQLDQRKLDQVLSKLDRARRKGNP